MQRLGAALEDEKSRQYKGRDHSCDVRKYDRLREIDPLVIQNSGQEIHTGSCAAGDQEYQELAIKNAAQFAASFASCLPKSILSEKA